MLLSILFAEFFFLIFYLTRKEQFEGLYLPTSTYFLSCIILCVLFAISSLTALFLALSNLFQNVGNRLMLYFLLPLILLTILMLLTDSIWVDKAVFLISGVTYIIIHTFFYLRLLKRRQKYYQYKASANMGFSAMLAEEYILIDISLITYCSIFTNITELWNIPSAIYL